MIGVPIVINWSAQITSDRLTFETSNKIIFPHYPWVRITLQKCLVLAWLKTQRES